MKLEWLPLALRDFDEIIDFIATDNPAAAIEKGDEIERQIAILPKTPTSAGRGGSQGPGSWWSFVPLIS